MVFSSDFAIISDGEVTSIKRSGSKKVNSRFSVDLSYKRAVAAAGEFFKCDYSHNYVEYMNISSYFIIDTYS
jgi:hypothetical protein